MSSNKTRTVVGQAVKFLQMMAFVFTHASSFKMNTHTTRPLQALTHAFTVSGWMTALGIDIGSAAYLALFYLALALAATLVFGVIWASISFVRNHFTVLWPLKLLRSIGSFSATVLYIPVLTLLLSTFNCSDPHTNPYMVRAIPCWEPGHIVQSVITGVLMVCFIAICGLFVLVFFDNHMLSTNLAAKVHGRVEFAFLVVKTVLVVLCDTLPAYIETWALIGVIIASGVVWAGMYLFYLPYLNASMNIANVGMAFAYTFSGICSAFSQGVHYVDGGFAVWIVGPLAAVAGAALCRWRIRMILDKPAASLRSAYEVEIKARLMLQTVLFGKRQQDHTEGFLDQSVAMNAVLAAAALNKTAIVAPSISKHTNSNASVHNSNAGNNGAMTARSENGASTARGLRGEHHHQHHVTLSLPHDSGAGNSGHDTPAPRGHRKSTHGGDAHSVSMTVVAGVSATAQELSAPSYTSAFPSWLIELREVLETEDDVEVRTSHVHRLFPRAAAEVIEKVYREGSLRFRTAALLHLIWGNFYTVFRLNRHLAMSHLLHAERKNPQLDVEYFIFAQRKASESNESSNGTMTALSRVEFEKHLVDARREVARASTRQTQYWNEMLDLCPDLNKLNRIAGDMNSSIERAENAFAQLFTINSTSAAVIRLYAEFVLYVSCDQERAHVLLAEADRIDEQQNKDIADERGAKLRVFQESPQDVSGDNMAVITMGGTLDNIGIILTVNAYACKLFGYNRWQLERRDIILIIPEPMASLHNGFLKAYLETGDTRIVDNTRVILAKHRAGHIFPVLLTVRESPASDGPPHFIGLIRPINSAEQHILMDSDFNLTAASALSLSALGLENAAIESGELNIRDWVAEWDAVQPELLSKGTTICFDSNRAQELALVGGEQSKSSDSISDAESDSDYQSTPLLLSRNRNLGDRRATQFNMMKTKTQANLIPSLTSPAQDANTWAKAQLQRVVLKNGTSIHVLYWQPINASTHVLAKAIANRRRKLQGVGLGNCAPSFIPSANRSNKDASASQPNFTFISACPVLNTASCAVRNSDYSMAPHPIPANTMSNLGSSEASGSIPQAAREIAFAAPAPKFPKLDIDAVQPQTTSDSNFMGISDIRTVLTEGSESPTSTVQATNHHSFVPSALSGHHGSASKAYSSDEDEEDDSVGKLRFQTLRNGSRSPTTGHPQSHTTAKHADLIKTTSPAQDLGTDLSRGQAKRHRNGRDDGEKRSVGGGSSKRSTARRLITRLRRVINDPRQPMLRALRWLQIVGILVTVLAIVLTCAFVMFMINEFARYLEGMENGQKAAQVLIACTSMVYGARNLIFNNLGWTSSSMVRNHTEMVESLGRISDTYLAMHQELSAKATDFDSTNLAMYDAATTDVVTFELGPTGVYVPMSSTKTMFEAGTDYAGVINKIRALDIGALRPSDPNFLYIDANVLRPEPLHTRLNQSMFGWHKAAIDRGSVLNIASLGVYIGVVSLVILMALAVVLPVLCYVDRTMDDVAKTLLKLPRNVLVRLRARASKRQQVLMKTDEDSDDESDRENSIMADEDFGFGDDTDARSTMSENEDRLPNCRSSTDDERREFQGYGHRRVSWAVEKPGNVSSSSSAVDSLSNSDATHVHVSGGDHSHGSTKGNSTSDPGMTKADLPTKGTESQQQAATETGPRPRRPGTPQNKQWKKNSRSLLSLISTFLLPIVSVVGFFTGLFVMSWVSLDQSLVSASLAITASNRVVLGWEYLIFTRRAVHTYGRATDIALSKVMNTAYDIGEDLQYHHDLITYGAHADALVSRGSASALARNALFTSSETHIVQELLLRDACRVFSTTGLLHEDTGDAYSLRYDDCSGISGKVLTHGLNLGLGEVLVKGRKILAQRAAAFIPMESTTGIGTVFDSDGRSTGNYSAGGVLRSPEMDEYTKLSIEYVFPGLWKIANIYSHAGQRIIKNYKSFCIIFSATFLSAYCLYMTVYLRQVRRFNRNIQKQRSMLMLLPHQVIRDTPEVQKLAEKIIGTDPTYSGE
jgi:PAS domain S-box-containing protein